MSRKGRSTWFRVLLMALVLGIGAPAHAQLTSTGGILAAGPGAGFPAAFTDDGGVALGLCLEPLCLPEIVNNVVAEAIYYSAEADMTGPNGEQFLLIIAVEAFPDPDPPGVLTVANAQRIRLRGLTEPGEYTVTTPFGTFGPFTAPPDVDAEDPINLAAAPDFVFALPGPVGTFASNGTGTGIAAGEFFGNGATPAPLTGAGFGTGLAQSFRVQGPGIDVTTSDFVVAGQIFAPIVPAGVVVERANFSRSAAGSGFVNVFAAAAVDATLNVSAPPLFNSTLMTGDGAGNFFASIPIAAFPPVLPLSVTVTDGTVNIAGLLTDSVIISKADYIAINNILLISASSSDVGAPAPILTAVGFGNLTGGTFVQQNLNVPPPVVTVTSSGGGSDTHPVSIVTTNPGVITVRRAIFTNRTGQLSINGRASGGARVTISGPAGPIATVTAGRTGLFRFNGPATLAAGSSLNLVSDAGALLSNAPVTFR